MELVWESHRPAERVRGDLRLTARGVSYTYRRGRVEALRDVGFEVEGGCVGLLGPNGAGKSTLLGLLTGALPLRSGSITPAVDPGRLGYVPQDLAVDPSLSVEQFLGYAAWLKKIPARAWRTQTGQVLEMLDLTDRRTDRVGTLSGGLRRRVSLAQAMLGQPRLIVLDEPTTALDPAQRKSLLTLIASVADEVGVVLSTHLVEDVVAVADAIVVLDQGAAVWHGPLSQVASGPNPAAELEEFFLSVTG